jgi:hypothetical protein
MNGTNGFDSNEGKSDRDPSRMNGPDAQARVHPEKDSEWDIES